MTTKPSRSKHPRDGNLKIGDAHTPVETIPDAELVRARSWRSTEKPQKTQKSLCLSAYSKQVLREYFEPGLAPFHDKALTLAELVANHPGAIASLLARTLIARDDLTLHESRVLLKFIAECAVEQIDALRTRRAKQLAPLDENRGKGALRNKQRAAEAHAQIRWTALELYEKNPTWNVTDMVEHIFNASEPIQGRKYSEATIRRAIRGAREEWRRDYEARRRVTGLYSIDH